MNKLNKYPIVANNVEESSKLLIEEQSNPSNDETAKLEKSKEYVKGKILYKTEWEGQAPDMPPTKIEDRVKLHEKRTKPNFVTNSNSNTVAPGECENLLSNLNNFDLTEKQNSLSEFNKLVKTDYPYDINDPRNVSIFDMIKKLKTEFLLKYLYKEYMLPYYDIKSIRQEILMKRVEKSSLRNVKIPLLERQIEADEQLQQIMRNALKEKEKLSQEEFDKKIKIQLEILNKNHSGLILSDEEFYAFLNEKIKTLRKDIVNKIQYSYFQIINEFYYASDFWKIVNNLVIDVCEQERRLKPKRPKKKNKAVDKCSLIKINVHVIKGYNIPIRASSLPNSTIEKWRENALNQVFRGVSSARRNKGFGFNFSNWFRRNNTNNNLNPNRSVSLGSFNNPGQNQQGNFMYNNMNQINNINNINPNFIGNNNLNNFAGFLSRNNNLPILQGNLPAVPNAQLGLNNSQLFNNIGTGNNSYNDVNLNVNPGLNNFNNILNNQNPNSSNNNRMMQDLNNLNIPIMSNNFGNNKGFLNAQPGLNGSINANNVFNPNINNILANPNANGYLPAYNLPNMYMNRNETPDLTLDGDILKIVDQLRSLERNVQSFVEVKMAYYDQKFSMRTDSIDGVHPDYNYKMQFEVKPINEGEHFTKEELNRSNGGLYFTLYDEVRTEDLIQEKESNTYIYKYEKKYLGSLFLPFTTIFQNASLLETVSKINVPMTVFGYYSDTSTAFDVQSKKEEDLRRQSDFMKMNMAGNAGNMNASQNSLFSREGKKTNESFI